MERTKKAFQSTGPGLRKRVSGEGGGFKNSPRVKGWEYGGLLSRLTAQTPLQCSWEEAVPGVGGWADWNSVVPDTSWEVGGR